MPYLIVATICNQKYYAEIDRFNFRFIRWQGLIDNATEFTSRTEAEEHEVAIPYYPEVSIEVKSKQELLKLKSRI